MALTFDFKYSNAGSATANTWQLPIYHAPRRPPLIYTDDMVTGERIHTGHSWEFDGCSRTAQSRHILANRFHTYKHAKIVSSLGGL